MSKQQIEMAIEKIPALTDYGVGVYNQHKLSLQERQEKFTKDRDVLLNSVESFNKTCDWLKQVNKIKSINRNRTSYGYKHIAEKDIGYITNGVFIAAAICCGFDFKITPGNPNVLFNISERSIKEIIKRQESGRRAA